jgi:hypothetical protein
MVIMCCHQLSKPTLGPRCFSNRLEEKTLLRMPIVPWTPLGNESLPLCVFFLFFPGTIAKYAQFSRHVCLPDAMVEPIPILAFIHTTTMVGAKISLLSRLILFCMPTLDNEFHLFSACSVLPPQSPSCSWLVCGLLGRCALWL